MIEYYQTCLKRQIHNLKRNHVSKQALWLAPESHVHDTMAYIKQTSNMHGSIHKLL